MSHLLLLPSPNLGQHLSDPSLNPLLTTASSQPTLESLTTLASTTLTTTTSLQHLSLGIPLRILVEYDTTSSPTPATSTSTTQTEPPPTAPTAPILLQSFIYPPDRHDHEDPAPGPIEEPPALIATVVGTGPEVAADARRAAGRLERVAAEFQREWAEEENQVVAAGVGDMRVQESRNERERERDR